MKYYYLLTGLYDLSLTSAEGIISRDELLTQLDEQLSRADHRLLDLLMEDPQQTELPEEREDNVLSEADQRTALYYEKALRCKNTFCRQWFEFNLNLNNVLTAIICRKHGFDVRKLIIGNNEVAEILRANNTAKDFGLSGTLDNYAELMALAATDNLLEREKKTDALRWQWLEENTLFHNFDIENVLAYFLQAEILHRWDGLTMEKGNEVFRALVADMKRSIPADALQ